MVAVHAAEVLEDPGDALFRHDVLQLGEPLEHPGHDQVREVPVGEERHLQEVHEVGRRGVAVTGVAGAAVLCDDQVQVPTHCPEPVVDRVVEARHAGVRWHGGEHEATEAVLGCQLQVGNGVVEVVQEHLRKATTAFGEGGAPVHQPAVVGADALEATLVLDPVSGRVGDERSGREERRHGIGKRDLSSHALCVQIGVAPLVVPVAGPAIVLEVAERVRVGAPPLGEGLPVARGEVLLVGLHVPAGMAVR